MVADDEYDNTRENLCHAGLPKGHGEGNAGDWVNRNLTNNILRDFKVHCRNAGIKTREKLNLHCLRKSYASNLANAGTPVHTLMKLMGHSSMVTTQKYYLHSSDENEKKAVEALEKLNSVEVNVVKD
jgi:integrase